MKKQVIKVRRLDNREVIHEVDVTGSSERRVEKVMRGLLRQMDTDKYFADDSEAYRERLTDGN